MARTPPPALLPTLLWLLLLPACATFAPPGGRTPEPGETALYTASWYGPKFHGRRTASGETFDMHALTAAHKTLPFGTRLEVTYPKTGASVTVTVNDRGPFVRGRDLDLSLGAARRIGLEADGVGRVRVRFLGRDPRYVKYIEEPRPPGEAEGTGRWAVQFGAFLDPANAERLKAAVDLTHPGAYIQSVEIGGRTWHRVRLGDFPSKAAALPRARELAREGYAVRILPR